MNTIGVLTSGGDSPGMNACIRSVVRYGLSQGLKVVGIRNGYAGIFEEDFIKMTERSVGNIIHVAGTILKTSRCKEFYSPEGIDRAAEILKKNGIDGLVVIGGDGSMRGAQQLALRGILTACVPGTIDNNLFYTDYTLGYDTAVNTVVELINNVRNTSVSHGRVAVVEVMGAGCGDIALSSGLATGADVILVPEMKWSIDEVCQKLEEARRHRKEVSIIVVSELVCEPKDLCQIITKKCDIECRPVILGHTQRGGTPTAFDRNLGTWYGAKAVDALMQGESGAVGYRGGKYVLVSFDDAFNGKRKFNADEYILAQKLSF